MLDNILFIKCKFSNQQCFKKLSRKLVYWFLLSSKMPCCKLSVRTWMSLTCLFLLCIFSILLVGMLSMLLISNQNNYSSLKIQDCVTFKEEPFPRQIDKILIVWLTSNFLKVTSNMLKIISSIQRRKCFSSLEKMRTNFQMLYCCPAWAQPLLFQCIWGLALYVTYKMRPDFIYFLPLSTTSL